MAEEKIKAPGYMHRYDTITGSYLEAMREISEADQEAVQHMRKNGPPIPSPNKKIPVTLPPPRESMEGGAQALERRTQHEATEKKPDAV